MFDQEGVSVDVIYFVLRLFCNSQSIRDVDVNRLQV